MLHLKVLSASSAISREQSERARDKPFKIRFLAETAEVTEETHKIMGVPHLVPAVIPKWVAAMIAGEQVSINGSGETSRDFCYIANVVQMNLLAATCGNAEAINQVYNVAVNARTDLNELFEMLRSRLVGGCAHLADFKPVYQDFRAGDVLHSQADISKAVRLVGYEPTYLIAAGLDEALVWYVGNVKK